MKNNVLFLLTLVFMISLSINAQRGVRIGYIDTEFILESVPEYQEATAQLNEKVDKWKNEKINTEFINFDKVLDEYVDFGGIRLEDDLLVTETGSQMIGKRIPITVEEVEQSIDALLK